jgi:hypothetical protein
MQKQLILTISILLISKLLLGQSSCDSSSVFAIAEVPPYPKISYEQIEANLNEKISLIHFALPENYLVEIRFIINCHGESLNYKMLTTSNPELFKEISQTLKNISWTPAMQGPRNVDIWKTLTISIKGGKLKILGEKDLKIKKDKIRK